MIDFDELIDQYLKRENYPKRIGRYYPSEIGNCLRKIWYTYKRPKQFEPEIIKVFQVGNMMHDFIVEVLKSEKTPKVELLEAEMPIKVEFPKFTVSGRVDDLMLVKESNEKILVEVKSCQHIENIKKAKEHHKMQLMFYMYATKIYKGIILYIDKTNLKTKAFHIDFDEIEAMEILNRFWTLHKKLSKDELPEPEAKKNEDKKWMCSYCEYKELCDENKK